MIGKKAITQISSPKSALRVKTTAEGLREIVRLLDLDDANFCRHTVGKLIRDNFRRRGWLKGKPRGTGKDKYSPERRSPHLRALWKEIVKSILERDKYSCQECGGAQNTKNPLCVHHVKEWLTYPDLRFEPSNLLTLCWKCHWKKHKFHRKELC